MKTLKADTSKQVLYMYVCHTWFIQIYLVVGVTQLREKGHYLPVRVANMWLRWGVDFVTPSPFTTHRILQPPSLLYEFVNTVIHMNTYLFFFCLFKVIIDMRLYFWFIIPVGMKHCAKCIVTTSFYTMVVVLAIQTGNQHCDIILDNSSCPSNIYRQLSL